MDAARSLAARQTMFPQETRSKAMLASCLLETGSGNDAEAMARSIIESEPNNCHARIVLARSEEKRRQFRSALRWLEGDVANPIEFPERLSEIVRLKKMIGDIEGARVLIQQGLDAHPESVPLIGQSVGLVEFAKNTSFQDNLERSLDSHAGANALGLAPLHYAAGAFFDKIEEHERAVTHWKIGAAIKHRHLNHDFSRMVEFLEACSKTNDGYDHSTLETISASEFRPVFIIGLPRSGSTLLEQTLLQSPELESEGELPRIEGAVDQLLSQFRSLPPYPYFLPLLRSDHVEELSQAYFRGPIPLDPKPRLISKYLTNSEYIPLLLTIFPRAKFIEIRRDNFASAMSMFTTNFANGNVPYSNDLEELAIYVGKHEALMSGFRAKNLERRFKSIRYEELVTEYEGVVATIFDFLELPIPSSPRDFYKSQREVTTASMLQVRRKLYADANMRWDPYRELVPELSALC